MKDFVLYFDQIDKSSLPYVGGKGANLGEMTRAGFPVPQGFCVTTLAYRTLVESSKDMQQLFDRLDQVRPDDFDEIRVLGQRIREHLESLPMQGEIKSAIVEAWNRTGGDKAYAVRSSATAEDLPTASFAGQQDTYLNVRGQEQLLQAIQRCWASLFTDRAISYRARNGFGHRSVFLSVVVQEMIFPEVSGIMFTADPITGNRHVVSIDASFGLGEALVSGLVSADLYQVRDGKIIQKKIAEKKIAIYSIPEGGTVTKDLPPEKQEVQSLSDKNIVALAKLGKLIERHYGSEQDIEWCISGENLYIVQSRPITSLYPMPSIPDQHLHLFFSFGHQQMMTDAMSPLALSMWSTFLPFGKDRSVQNESKYALKAGNRLFIDLTDLLQLKPAKKIVPHALNGIDERIGSGISEVMKRPEFQRTPNRQVKKTAIRTILPIAANIAANLLFRNPSQAIHAVNALSVASVQECERFILGASGAERIKRIQESIGNLALYLFGKIGTYPFSGIVATKLIEKCTKKWLGDSGRVHLLNKSLPGNVTTELGLMIGDLADIARQHPEVVAYLQTAKDESFYEGLHHVEGGSEFRQALERFMDRYGMRCSGEIDVKNPRWQEVPTSLVPSIMSQIRSLEPGEHRRKFLQGKSEAEETATQLIDQVRNTRGGFLKAKIMCRLIRVYRNVMGLREHPKYVIVQHLNIYKQAILEKGNSLVRQGTLQEASDVFYLSLEELYALETGRFSGNVQQLVEERKKQHEQHKKLTPPRVMTSEGEVITGRTRDVQAPEGARIGTPVSSGVVEGYARVVLRPEEAKLNAGEILIAPFTDPGWTPLFNSAKGLVMEVGGMMTHGAVVAREYGIPAVVGIDHATQIIKDGMYIRVDGSQGYVQILEEDEHA